jgi:pectin methylesterase-like acyl-CoA thioesterase
MNQSCFRPGKKIGGLVLAGALAIPPTQAADATEGSGNFTNVQAAVNAVPVNGPQPFVMVLKPGRYAGQACCGSPVFNQFPSLGTARDA